MRVDCPRQPYGFAASVPDEDLSSLGADDGRSCAGGFTGVVGAEGELGGAEFAGGAGALAGGAGLLEGVVEDGFSAGVEPGAGDGGTLTGGLVALTGGLGALTGGVVTLIGGVVTLTGGVVALTGGAGAVPGAGGVDVVAGSGFFSASSASRSFSNGSTVYFSRRKARCSNFFSAASFSSSVFCFVLNSSSSLRLVLRLLVFAGRALFRRSSR